MKVFTGIEFGRYFIIGLQKDDLILESIKKVISDYDIRNAIITSGISAVNHMRWHHVKDTNDIPTDVIYELDGPIEVAGINGLVINGIPHVHCSFADHNRSWSGHLEDGTRVQYVGEISMIELMDIDPDRLPNQFGINLLSDKE